MSKTKITVALVLCGGALLAIGLGVPAFAGGPKMAPDATPEFAVFEPGRPAARDARLAELAEGIAHVDRGDLQRARVLRADVGKYSSDLIAFPSQRGGNVCYTLLAKRVGDPGMTYCYQPKSEDAPLPLAGQKFHAVALQVNDGEFHTQLFGIAFDDVKSLRVNVAGEWLDLPLRNNGFYLELPGVPHRAVGVVEATLAEGSTQIHDIQLGG